MTVIHFNVSTVSRPVPFFVSTLLLLAHYFLDRLVTGNTLLNWVLECEALSHYTLWIFIRVGSMVTLLFQRAKGGDMEPHAVEYEN